MQKNILGKISCPAVALGSSMIGGGLMPPK